MPGFLRVPVQFARALIRPYEEPAIAVTLWTAFAAINLSVAYAHAIQPGYSGDLWEVRAWFDYLKTATEPVYQQRDFVVDYPPLGLLLLSFFQWIPAAVLPVVWASVNVPLSVVAAWMCVRTAATLAGVQLSRREIAMYAAFLLCGSSFRSAIWWGQTSSLVMTCAMLALAEAKRRPVLAGLVFALASYKLNVAAGVALALLLMRAWTPLAICAAVNLAAWVGYAWYSHQTVFSLASDYVALLFRHYGSPASASGVTGMHAFIEAFLGHGSLSAWVAGVMTAISLVAVIVLCWKHGLDSPPAPALIAATALMWDLMWIFNLQFNAPLGSLAVLLLWWPQTSPIRAPWLRDVFAAVIVLRGTFSVQVWLRLGAEQGWLPLHLRNVWLHGSRFMMAAIFIILLYAIIRHARAHEAARRPELLVGSSLDGSQSVSIQRERQRT